jgi:hypothetical protein
MNFDYFYKSLGITQEEIANYSNESKYGGYPEEPGGSVWSDEGKSIFNLIRHLKPKRILEVGNLRGASSNHILQAVELNGFGEVTLVDIAELIDYSKIHNRNFKRVLQDSIIFLDNELDYDFIILDGDHRYEHVKKELELVYKNNKPAEYYIWAHDYREEEKKEEFGVKQAWDESITEINELLFKISSNCGVIFTKVNKSI